MSSVDFGLIKVIVLPIPNTFVAVIVGILAIAIFIFCLRFAYNILTDRDSHLFDLLALLFDIYVGLVLCISSLNFSYLKLIEHLN